MRDVTITVFLGYETDEEKDLLNTAKSGYVEFLGATYFVNTITTKSFTEKHVLRKPSHKVVLELSRCIPNIPIKEITVIDKDDDQFYEEQIKAIDGRIEELREDQRKLKAHLEFFNDYASISRKKSKINRSVKKTIVAVSIALGLIAAVCVYCFYN